MSGPQNDRDRVWIGKHAELSREREDLSIDRGSEKQVFEGELVRLRRENGALKDQLQRALKELKFYQHRYPSAYAPGNRGDDEELPPWKTSPELMTPLLEAYDTRIAELEGVTNRQNEDMKHFQEKMQMILGENEQLRAAQLENLERAGRESHVASSPLNEELMHEMNERVEILMAENALMVEQKAVMSSELERLQGDYEKCEEELNDLAQQYDTAKRDLAELTSRLPQAEQDRLRATGEVAKASEALGKAIAEADELREQLSIWKENCTAAEEGLMDARKALKAMSDNSQEEGFSCVRRTKAAEDRVKELHGLLHGKTQELEGLQESHRKLRRDYQSTRQDAEGMLQVMSAQERQIADYGSRESEVEALSRECKERIEEAMIARDQAISRENQVARLNERLLEEKRSDAQAKQVEVDEAVQATRSRAEQKIRGLDEQLAEAAARGAQSKSDEMRAQKEFLSAKEALERLRVQAEDERRSFESALKGVEERLKHAEVGRNEDSVRRREVQEQNKALRSSIDGLRAQVETNRIQLTDRDFARDREISTLKNSLREVQASLGDANKALHRRNKELEELRSEDADLLASLDKKREDDVNMHRRRAEEADAKMREFETGANGEARRSKYILDQIKDKFSVTMQQLETQLEKEKTDNKRLEGTNIDLAESCRVVADERASLEKVVRSLKSKNAALRDDVQEAQDTVSELTEQLTSSFEAREQAVKLSVREMEKINTASRMKSRAVGFLKSSTDNIDSYYRPKDRDENSRDNYNHTPRSSANTRHSPNASAEVDDGDNQSVGSGSDAEAIGDKNFDDVLLEAHKTFNSPTSGSGSGRGQA